MQSPPSQDSGMEVIDNFEAIRLLINVFLIKKAKRLNKPVNQEKFIDNVRKEFRNRGYNYSKKQIIHTWKYLLENYQYYKENLTSDDTAGAWTYFNLMDNCFVDSKQTSEKFKDSKWTFFLIESLCKYKPVVLQQGLTMDILQAVEDDFQEAQNYNINQRDIYKQWVFLKRVYRQNKKTGFCKQHAQNVYFSALKNFFESEMTIQCPVKQTSRTFNIRDNELTSAIESIKDDEGRKIKKQKIDCKVTSKSINIHTLPNDDFSIETISVNNNLGSITAPLTNVMHDILLQCLKINKDKIQKLNGVLDEDILNEIVEEFLKLGHNTTHELISNEWNDLFCRYELIKNSEYPEKWPFYNDMNYIFHIANINEQQANVDDEDNQSTIGSIIIENLRKNQNLRHTDYAALTERLLNIYEANSREFLEIKDILLERNLLREETNYLLNILVEKIQKKR